MNKTLAIIGAGDLGMQIANYAIRDNHYKDVVFFDDFADVQKKNGFHILGTTSDIIEKYHEKSFDEIIIGIGYNHLDIREKIYNELENTIPFGKIVHSSCWIDDAAEIKAGSVIYPHCTIDYKAIVDHNTILNLGCTVAHDTFIGKHCFLSPRVAIAGFVNISNKCILGINSTIIDNININQNVHVGGGTVVIKDIFQSGLYVGNPQRFIKNKLNNDSI